MATAVPDELVIKPGDDSGEIVTCKRADVRVWHPGDDPDAPSPCGHVYTKPGTYKIEATVKYKVTWTATGGGLNIVDQPLEGITGDGEFDIKISEAQAVIDN